MASSAHTLINELAYKDWYVCYTINGKQYAWFNLARLLGLHWSRMGRSWIFGENQKSYLVVAISEVGFGSREFMDILFERIFLPETPSASTQPKNGPPPRRMKTLSQRLSNSQGHITLSGINIILKRFKALYWPHPSGFNNCGSQLPYKP